MTIELKPYEYQSNAVDFWIEKEKVYFAIGMGLGKTLISYLAMNYFNLPSLVIAPLKVANNTWPDELEKWGFQDDFSLQVLHGPNKLQKFKSKPKSTLLHIINYEGIKWLYTELYKLYKAKKPIPYKVLILDESTLIKDPHSDRFGYLCAMRDLFKYIALLSGTPAPNTLMDLWAQYFILDGGKTLGTDYRAFRKTFFEQDPYRKYKWTPRFGSENVIHKKVSKITFRLSESDHGNLPERIYNQINLDLHSRERKQYESFKKDFVLTLGQATVKSLNQASLSTKLRQFVQGFLYENCDDGSRKVHRIHRHKVDSLKEIIEANEGQSILCLTQFKAEVDMLLEEFPKTPVIDSRTKSSISDQYIRDWNKKKIPLLIAHPRSVGRGLNLQAGGHILVWYALTWSLDDYLQANKRLHRPGQKETVVIHHLIMKGTIDETVFKALKKKDMTQERLLEYLRQETMKYAV